MSHQAAFEELKALAPDIRPLAWRFNFQPLEFIHPTYLARLFRLPLEVLETQFPALLQDRRAIYRLNRHVSRQLRLDGRYATQFDSHAARLMLGPPPGVVRAVQVCGLLHHYRALYSQILRRDLERILNGVDVDALTTVARLYKRFPDLVYKPRRLDPQTLARVVREDGLMTLADWLVRQPEGMRVRVLTRLARGTQLKPTGDERRALLFDAAAEYCLIPDLHKGHA